MAARGMSLEIPSVVSVWDVSMWGACVQAWWEVLEDETGSRVLRLSLLICVILQMSRVMQQYLAFSEQPGLRVKCQ